MPAKINLNLTGETFTDELHTDVGAVAFKIDHDWFWGSTDLVIRTASGGGGTLLVEATDYQLSVEDTDLTTRSSKTVYGEIQIINATYQTGALYFSGEYIADSVDADDSNEMKVKGYVYGLTLSNNVTDADNDIDIAAGECRDSDGDYLLVLSSSITKQLDAAWAEGTDAGGLDTGSMVLSETYHVFLIREDIAGTIDVLFSLSATAPTMPSGWTAKRRIGAVLTDADTDIIAFIQYGEEFWFLLPVQDYDSTVGTTAILATLTVPSGIQVKVTVRVAISLTGQLPYMLISSPDVIDAFSISTPPGVQVRSVVAGSKAPAEISLWTDTSQQVRLRSSNASTVTDLMTVAWADRRGRNGGA